MAKLMVNLSEFSKNKHDWKLENQSKKKPEKIDGDSKIKNKN